MIDFRNPYTPGAGVMPKYLAGRDSVIDKAKQSLRALIEGYPTRSVVYYGLRGVGKTVLLNAVEEAAEDLKVLNRHLEVKENSNFTRSLAIACGECARSLSFKESLKEKMGRLAAVIQSFSATWNPEDQTISLEMKEISDGSASAGSGDLSVDLTELMVTLGKYAQQGKTAICFCVDEIQYAKESELEALITALHRANQLGLPITFFCAGLPKILKTMGDVKSYTERLFEFVHIDSLEEDDAYQAIVVPAAKLGVEYSDEAVRKIIELTGCYPYFIQEMCSTIWGNYDSRNVSLQAVIDNVAVTNKKLDDGFFMVRYERCTQMERNFLAAMVKCGDLPCTIACVARFMGKTQSAISPYRGQLISKGLIYATGHGEIDFTVPQFDAFIKRTHPDFS